MAKTAKVKLYKVTFTMDAENYKSLQDALDEWKRTCTNQETGEVLVADGYGSLPGKILAEVCRSFLEYRAGYRDMTRRLKRKAAKAPAKKATKKKAAPKRRK